MVFLLRRISSSVSTIFWRFASTSASMPFLREAAQVRRLSFRSCATLSRCFTLSMRRRIRRSASSSSNSAVLVVGVADDVLDPDLVLPQLVAEVDDLADGHRGVEDGREDHVLALLDALRDLDLALAREERDAAHLAQVHPDRVVALRGVAVDDFLGLGRGRGRGLLAIARPLLLGLLFGDALRSDLHLCRGVDDLDVLVAEDPQNVVHLIGGHVGRQGVVDLVVGEEALGLPHLDELLNFLPITVLRCRHHYLGVSALFPASVPVLPTPRPAPCRNDGPSLVSAKDPGHCAAARGCSRAP